ncbi:alcohol dehydrogenase catalytic domain-containing protein, partial [Escherichia coli]|nr:alcohol dehydrogenase catalytic domain-containing protein [Escherichia coli]
MTMRAVVFEGVGRPLRVTAVERPTAGPGELELRVRACGVCRTDLHLLDGEVEVPSPPRILGHQVVGEAADGTL